MWHRWTILSVISLVLPAGLAWSQIRVGNIDPDIKIETFGGPSRIEINFEDTTTVAELIAILTEVTGKNVIIKDKASQQVTVFARGEFTKQEAYELIVSTLSTADLELEHHGRYIRIVPAKKPP